jgi:RNA polymerase sigma factor (sigma-70 family)
MHDHKIIELIRSKNEDKALTALYRHFPMIRKNIIANGGNSEDAEDIFQETLIILCRKVKQQEFKLTSQLSTYLFGISRFLWRDELRKRKPFTTVSLETGLDGLEEKSLDELLEQENEAKLAEKILLELGDRCQEILLLFYKAGMSLKDIASRPLCVRVNNEQNNS